MKVILPLGRSVVGVATDVASWLAKSNQKVTSIVLVAAPGDSLEIPSELYQIAPVDRVEVTPKGDFYPNNFDDQGTVVVVNGGTTVQQWAITKWWWQKLFDQGTAYQWESYRAPDSGKWNAVAVNVQKDGVQELAWA